MTVAADLPLPRWALLVLVLAACLAARAAAANATDPASAEDDDDGDVDFVDDPPPEQVHRAPPSPVSVYVLRLLEILTGVETLGKHTRYSRAARVAREGYGYPSPPVPLEPPESGRANVNTAASYSNYYDFLINEGSYKFWAFFQIATAVLLVYSAFAALYYARYTYYTNVDYSEYDDDYFFRRSGRAQRSAPSFQGLHATEFQRVMDAADGARFSVAL